MILTPPVCQRVPGTSHDWILWEDWRLCLDQFSKAYPRESFSKYCKGRKLLVKAGFRYDGESKPQATWSIIGDPMRDPCSGLCHDACYKSELMPRAACDDLLYYMLKAEGRWWLSRHLIYRAVHNCGGLVWMDHTEQSVEDARQYVELVSCYAS